MDNTVFYDNDAIGGFPTRLSTAKQVMDANKFENNKQFHRGKKDFFPASSIADITVVEQLPEVSAPGIELPKGRVCLTGKAGRSILMPCKPEEPLGPRVFPPETSVIETDVMPKDLNLFPEISNGHVATVVQTNTIYMNGLYNGPNVNSHRARIPSTAAVLVSFLSPTNVTVRFQLDLERAVFSEVYTGDGFTVEVRRYAHRAFHQLSVTEINMNRTHSVDPIILSLFVNTGPNSQDIDFTMSEGVWTGKTKEAEYPKFSGVSPVSVVFSVVPTNVTFLPGAQGKVAFFTSVSSSLSDAQENYEIGVSLFQDGNLFWSHVKLWDDLWQRGHIEMAGNDSMALSTNAALYYLTSALPLKSDEDWPFVGMSPGGLAHGAAGQDYQGHVFWDQDTWMFPSIMLLHCDLGRIIVDTRLRTYPGAKYNAQLYGLKGARYPIESGFTGIEVSPSEATATYEIHTTADTSLMIHRYLQLTNDTDFLTLNGGYNVLADMADCYVSRSEFNSTSGMYGINGVMGPDEYHVPVNNSVYTNVGAAKCMRTAQFAAQKVGQTPKPEWNEVASKMQIEFDNQNQYHPEYTGYTRGTIVKQADTILIAYPVDWPMTDDVKYNDLTYYSSVTPSGPAMTWGIFTIGWLAVGEKVKADRAFYRGTWNEKKPFKVWSENADGVGAHNFHTGMGGYLQSLLFGYVGFDLEDSYLSLNPQLPPSLTRMAARGVDYLLNSFDVTYNLTQMNVTLTQAEGVPLCLTLTKDIKTVSLLMGSTVTADCQPAMIFSC